MKLSWRRYKPEDETDLRMLKADQDRALGRKMDLPKLEDHPVLVSEVAVDEDGRVVGAIFFESVPEFCMVSRSPEVTASMRRHAPEVLSKLKECGFRVVRTEIPRFMDVNEQKAIMEELGKTGNDAGFPFAETDSEYRHGMFDLRIPGWGPRSSPLPKSVQ